MLRYASLRYAVVSVKRISSLKTSASGHLINYERNVELIQSMARFDDFVNAVHGGAPRSFIIAFEIFFISTIIKNFLNLFHVYNMRVCVRRRGRIASHPFYVSLERDEIF